MKMSQKVIAFLSNKLTLRGTEIALYDYAEYNEKILGNKSIIITRDYNVVKNEFDVDIKAYEKFVARFPVIYYDPMNTVESLDYIVSNYNISHLYIIKFGSYTDRLYSTKCKNIIHAVFDTRFPHGDVYCTVGQTVNDSKNTNFPVLPHIISLPNIESDSRSLLNIRIS